VIPCDLASEEAVLGAVLLEPKRIFQAADLLEADDFYLEAHRIIWQAMLDMMADASQIDPIVLVSRLQTAGQLEQAGGYAGIARLTDGMPRGTNVRHYARILKQKSGLRKVLAEAQVVINLGLQPEADLENIISRLSRTIMSVDTRSDGYVPIADMVDAGYKRLQARAASGGIPGAVRSGLQCLDSHLGGFVPGSLVLVAARPSQGKSSLCAGIALDAALRQGKAVGISTLEMSQGEVYDRMICSEASIDLCDLTHGKITRQEWDGIAQTSGRLSGARIWIDETGGISIRQLQARAERLRAEHQIDILIVDYLGLLKGTGGPSQSRVQIVSEISGGLKELAKRLKIPVLAASQLNRDSARDNREPNLADLRDSGSLEQDADQVIMIHKPESSQADCLCTPVSLIVAKNRHGRTGRYSAGFHKRFTRFVDMHDPE